MKLIVGLGNPGKEYEKTRHNVGFIILDNLNSLSWKKRDNYLYAEDNTQNEKIIYLKPQTFMNLSGEAVLKAASYYKIDSKDILVIRDDLDLPENTYKIKFNSSSGGHNGIKDIIKCLKTEKFTQLKIGIGQNKFDTINYVLGKLSKENIEYLKSDIFSDIINSFINDGIDNTLSNYNGKRE